MLTKQKDLAKEHKNEIRFCAVESGTEKSEKEANGNQTDNQADNQTKQE